MSVLILFAAILQENRVTIDEKVAEQSSAMQITGLAQGDNLGTLLFSIWLRRLPD